MGELAETPTEAKQEPGTFLLHIREAKLSDAGLYYCLQIDGVEMTFLNGTFLRIGGPEPDINAVLQDRTSEPVRPGDSVTLQCSVLSDSEKKACPGEQRVFWFRAGSDDSPPSLMYVHGNRAACEKSPEDKCVYSFSQNVSSSDAGTLHCAVVTCGEILFGKGTKLDIKAPNKWDLQKANTVVIVLLAALTISLIVIAVLIYTIKTKTCACCNAAVALQTNAATSDQQRNEDLLAYSAPTFTKRHTGRTERKNVKPSEEETIYSDVRT
ncbi:signal-regulatory protein beta-2-like [Clinocottus analis]|uniref:signal-regulatory protein beta-2-like n=1 Tax=Clinocottus analis TaxID=304258 RepID=UPI0035C13421